jgi:hypothetical protein
MVGPAFTTIIGQGERAKAVGPLRLSRDLTEALRVLGLIKVTHYDEARGRFASQDVAYAATDLPGLRFPEFSLVVFGDLKLGLEVEAE